jgi:hypothetical protein
MTVKGSALLDIVPSNDEVIPSCLRSYSVVACVGTTPTYRECVSVAILLVASLYL